MHVPLFRTCIYGKSEISQKYLLENHLKDKMKNTTHIAWATVEALCQRQFAKNIETLIWINKINGFDLLAG